MNAQKAEVSARADRRGQARPHGISAAHHATNRNASSVTVPVLGTITLPPTDQLAYLSGVAVLTALEIIEWPVALVLGAGHLLASHRNNHILADFGEALEQA